MSVLMTDDQAALVSTRRLKAAQRPQWYNASLGNMVRISEDFEAFLILQGRPKNKETVDWLQKASSYAIGDADRDSLLDLAIKNEITDATAAAIELSPVIDQFTSFRQRFNMTGFEGVTEAGQLLSDLQRPMNEIITLGSKHQHRKQYASILSTQLINNGLTANQTKQVNSWFESLTTY